MRLPFLLLLSTLVLTGCGGAGKSSYLADKPLLILPDSPKKSENLQQEATQAFLKALDRYRWQVRGLNSANNTVIAEACRRGEHCAEIEATIQADGTVSIVRTPGQKLTANEGNMLKQWMGSLQREYKKNMQFIR